MISASDLTRACAFAQQTTVRHPPARDARLRAARRVMLSPAPAAFASQKSRYIIDIILPFRVRLLIRDRSATVHAHYVCLFRRFSFAERRSIFST